MEIYGASDPYMVSHIIAEGVISQLLSVLALVAIAWYVIRVLPELLIIIDDVAYMVTGEDRDTAAELGLLPDEFEGRLEPRRADD
jgi:archaeosortase A (PGF-CTERM-specific)